MEINWKVRFKNKSFLLTFITMVLAFIYQCLGMFGIVPKVSQDMMINFISLILNILAAYGILIDPTTKGSGDSDRALNYVEPGVLPDNKK